MQIVVVRFLCYLALGVALLPPASCNGLSLDKLVIGTPCTDACDVAVPATSNSPNDYGVFCGIDGRTYNTTVAAFKTNFCYSYCGVAARYFGLCGCPNNCGSHVGHGQCVTVDGSNDIQCECQAGFGGDDCMMVHCASGNTCSGHGVCRPQPQSQGGDFCACDDGYTGAYCAQPVFRYPLYNATVPNVPPLLQPGYDFVTPVLNMSIIGDLRVQIDPSDFDYLIDPFTVYNASKESKPVSVFFTNGLHMVQNVSALMSVKGATSRLDLKKGWKIEFLKNKESSGFFGLKEIGLKTGNGGNDSCMKPFIMSSLGRMAGVMLSRPAMTTLYVNGVFMGLYFFDEAVDDAPFLEAAYGTGDGPIVKLTFAAFLRFHGWNATFYQTQGEPIFAGGVLNYIETKDWEPYIEFVHNVSLPDMVPSSLVDVDGMLRMIAMEAFALDDDHFLAGNNYFLYRPHANKSQWVLVDHDFDTEFAPKHGVAVPPDPLRYPFDDALNGNNALVVAVFNDPAYLARYTEIVTALVSSPILSSKRPRADINHVAVSEGSDSTEPLPSVYRRLASFLYAWVEADVLQQFAFNTTAQSFNATAWSTSNILSQRADTIVENFIAGRGVPSDNLSDAEIGGIAGGVVVLLIVGGLVLRRFRNARRHASSYEAVSEQQARYL